MGDTLIGRAEIERLGGVTKRRANMWIKTAGFPEPVVDRKWWKSEVQQWLREQRPKGHAPAGFSHSPETIAAMRVRLAETYNVSLVAREFGMGRNTVYRHGADIIEPAKRTPKA